MTALIDSTERAGVWTIQSGVFAENTASLALHASCGFRVVGTREHLGERCAAGLGDNESDTAKAYLVGPGGLLDDDGHVANAYGTDGLVLVRPDGYIGLVAGPTETARRRVPPVPVAASTLVPVNHPLRGSPLARVVDLLIEVSDAWAGVLIFHEILALPCCCCGAALWRWGESGPGGQEGKTVQRSQIQRRCRP